MTRPIRRHAALQCLALACLAGTPAAIAQQEPERPQRHGVLAPPPGDNPDIRTPPMTEGVLRALEASYLKEPERARLRVFHGVWTPQDLENPALRAAAAVIAGVYDDPSLSDPAAAPEDRAEGALRRGEPRNAIDLLDDATTPRARRVRAESLEMLGRVEEALAAVAPLAALLANQSASAEEVVEGVRAMRIRGRIAGQQPGDFQRMIELLVHAQQSVDRLYWPALVEQAEILWDKDNAADAQKARLEALSLNPSIARAWRQLGEASVSGFAFDAAEGVAQRLRVIGSTLGDSSGGVEAALILARARMRQNAPDLAEEALAPVLARMPAQREALALRAAVQAQRHDEAGTDERLAAFDALWATPPADPDKAGPTEALLAVGRALSESRQYDRAAAYLRRAAARNPAVPDALIELGLLSVQAGNDAEARDALRAATKMDPFNTRAVNSLTLVEELATYARIESEHFIVRHKPGVDEVVAKELVAPLERIHAVVCATFQHEPRGKTIIELMPDHQWFAVRITGMPGIHTIAASTGPVIAMEAPREGRNHFGVYDWERVVRHEFAHTVNLSQTRYRVPHWFTEAAAVSVEFAPYDFQTCQLLVHVLSTDALFDLTEINEAFVRPRKPTDRQQAYMQGNWMYRYIVDQWGASAPVRLMERFALGEREPKAFPAVLNVSTDAFMVGFRAWAKKDAASWGMLPSPSLDDLRLQWMLDQPEEREGLTLTLRRAARVAAALTTGAAALEDPSGALGIEFAPARADLVESWLTDHPQHPDLLELSATDALNAAGDEVTPEIVELLKRYAAARPMDPMPHRRLARHFLAQPSDDEKAKAIPSLEFLDIREQYSPVYASALSRLYASPAGGSDLDKAWEKIERATRISGYDPALREQAATIALRRKKPRDAQRHIEALGALEPKQDVHRQRLEAVRRMPD